MILSKFLPERSRTGERAFPHPPFSPCSAKTDFRSYSLFQKKHPRPGRKHDLGRIVFDTARSEFGASAAVILSTPKNPRRTVRNSVQAGDWVDYA